MKTPDTHAFVNQFLVWLLVTLSVSGSIGVGTVWFRHQISATANANRLREARLADLQRRIDETTTLIAGEQITSVLQARNALWRLGLVPATDAQVVRVSEDPMLRLARRNNLELLSDRAAQVSFRVAAKE
jgi:hypothetical protein